MNLRTFLLVDSLALDIAGIAALVAGHVALGIALLAVAGVAFAAFVARGRQARLVA